MTCVLARCQSSGVNGGVTETYALAEVLGAAPDALWRVPLTG